MAGYRIDRVAPLFEGWRKILGFKVRMPDGRAVDREILEADDAAAVLPYDRERRTVVLVRQFRVPALHRHGEQALLEAIAGLLEGSDPRECAIREAMEEAGLRLSSVEPVGSAWASPGAMTEMMHLFLAPYTAEDRIGEGGGLAEEHEDIEVLEVGCDELGRMLDENVIMDLKTLSLAQALRLRHPELFGKA